jgi:cell division protein FtsL
MSRLNLILLLALMLSSLYLVDVSYESRRLFAELDRERARALRLESDHERLQLDARSQATPLRVERVAREKLAMRNASPGVTEYLAAPAAASAAFAPPAVASASFAPQARERRP